MADNVKLEVTRDKLRVLGRAVMTHRERMHELAREPALRTSEQIMCAVEAQDCDILLELIDIARQISTPRSRQITVLHDQAISLYDCVVSRLDWANARLAEGRRLTEAEAMLIGRLQTRLRPIRDQLGQVIAELRDEEAS